MAEKTNKSDIVTSVTATKSTIPDSTFSSRAALVLDDINRQHQTAQLFIEASLQPSRLTPNDNNDSDSVIQGGHASSVGQPSSTGYPVENEQERPRSSQTCVSNGFIKASSSPVAKKRSSRHTPVSSAETQFSDVTNDQFEVMLDSSSDRYSADNVTDSLHGNIRVQALSASDNMLCSRRKGSHVSEGGRRSRDRSESESDAGDTFVVFGSYAADDVRRQMAGSVTPEANDVGFQPSMLDAVLTEKKLALLRSPEVRAFLQQQQQQRAREQKLTHRSPAALDKGDNPS